MNENRTRGQVELDPFSSWLLHNRYIITRHVPLDMQQQLVPTLDDIFNGTATMTQPLQDLFLTYPQIKEAWQESQEKANAFYQDRANFVEGQIREE